jgi:hypothetical protein
VIQTYFSLTPLSYDGTQLHSHFAYKNFAVQGPSLVAFIGGCDVRLTEMVDLADVKAGKPIFSHSMVHFIFEKFELNLDLGIFYQRLLVCHIKEYLEHHTRGIIFKRSGNDLYDGKAKLNVSIATLSPVSTLVHVGINVISKDTPVLTKGLKDYGVVPTTFAKNILKNFLAEYESIQMSRTKVRGVS